jgi:hypothetical protein
MAKPLTAAGQRRLFTELSPLPPWADFQGTEAEPYHRIFKRNPNFQLC